MKILEKVGDGRQVVFIGFPICITDRLRSIIQNYDVTIFFITKDFYKVFFDFMPYINTSIGKVIPAVTLDDALELGKYKEYLEALLEKMKQHRVKHALLVSHMWAPQYLDKLKREGIQIATKLFDDPEGSKYYSVPVVKYYDKCICSGVNYDKKKTIEEMCYQWGAPNVRFLPVLVDPRHYDEESIDYTKKNIDIVHAGSFNWKRWISLYRLHQAFGDRIKFYCYYDSREIAGMAGFIYRLLNVIFPLPKLNKASDEELKEVYKRSKIGFNRHLSYGPSNSRSYELCLNGILQITDNPKGYKRIYTVGKEIVCYRNMGEAIALIKYYLENDEEREKIAKAGHEKALAEYTYETVFRKHLEYILS